MSAAVPRGKAGLQKDVFGLATNRIILYYLCTFPQLLLDTLLLIMPDRLHLSGMCYYYTIFLAKTEP